MTTVTVVRQHVLGPAIVTLPAAAAAPGQHVQRWCGAGGGGGRQPAAGRRPQAAGGVSLSSGSLAARRSCKGIYTHISIYTYTVLNLDRENSRKQQSLSTDSEHAVAKNTQNGQRISLGAPAGVPVYIHRTWLGLVAHRPSYASGHWPLSAGRFPLAAASAIAVEGPPPR